ncbi:MAG: PLP-dependent aminotransferase family protein [Rhodospirillaceae bacterium]|nr:PLP-dependent aminotransferase family protein [Rhodospirillales bacterium]
MALPPLDRASPEPLQRQLALALREAILAGQLAAGTRLPSTRRLASQLGLGRNTVLAAFEHLLAEGFIEARQGSGTVVAALPPVSPPAPRPERPLSARAALLTTIEGPRGRRWGQFLAPGVPDLDQFPFAEWSRLLARRWRRPGRDLLVPDNAAGHPPLRHAIAQWLGRTRAIRCTAEQVMIVSGSQQALDLAARVLLDPGDQAMVEDPGYNGLKGVLRAAGAQVAPVPVDDQGFDAALGETLWPQARLAWVTPSHQFPTGVTMPLARRLALVEWARRRQGWIIEDDYDGEFRHAGPPLAALQGLDRDHRTIHLGTFSKSMFPGLRLGWLVLPEDLVAPFTAARQLADMAPPSLTQAAMADFMADGLFAQHLKRMRALYAARRIAFTDACNRHLTRFGTLTPGEAGLHSVLWLNPGADDRAAADKAQAAGLAVPALSEFRLIPGPPGLVLGWGSLPEDRMDGVVAKLAAALG